MSYKIWDADSRRMRKLHNLTRNEDGEWCFELDQGESIECRPEDSDVSLPKAAEVDTVGHFEGLGTGLVELRDGIRIRVKEWYQSERGEDGKQKSENTPGSKECQALEGFRTIRFADGRTFYLTPNQAAIVSYVVREHGQEPFLWSSVQEQVAVYSQSFRKGAFRSRPEAFDQLFELVGNGRFRLKVVIAPVR